MAMKYKDDAELEQALQKAALDKQSVLGQGNTDAAAKAYGAAKANANRAAGANGFSAVGQTGKQYPGTPSPMYSTGNPGSQSGVATINPGSLGSMSERFDELFQEFNAASPPQNGYRSEYSADIDSLLNQILNGERFAYDPVTDPVYQQYRHEYMREGTRSMNDTLAAMASDAGGMNSWAATAAQQANDYYATQLADKIPELYQIAYDMYLNDRSMDVENLGLLMDMDGRDYDRWLADRDWQHMLDRESVDDERYEWDKQHTLDREAVADERYDREWDYGVSRDEIADERYDREWEYGVSRDEVSDARYEQELYYQICMDLIDQGKTPTAEMLQKAGLYEVYGKTKSGTGSTKKGGNPNPGPTDDDTGGGGGDELSDAANTLYSNIVRQSNSVPNNETEANKQRFNLYSQIDAAYKTGEITADEQWKLKEIVKQEIYYN